MRCSYSANVLSLARSGEEAALANAFGTFQSMCTTLSDEGWLYFEYRVPAKPCTPPRRISLGTCTAPRTTECSWSLTATRTARTCPS